MVKIIGKKPLALFVNNRILRRVCYRRLYLYVVGEEKGGGGWIGKLAIL
jgi:hypothetical protein